MEISIRSVTSDDVPFLWDMLFHAARMSEDGAASSDAAKSDPHLNLYVSNWGRHGDIGVIASDLQTLHKLGAAWLRLLTEDKSHYGYYDDRTPELAIATLPDTVGQGIGSAMLSHLIMAAQGSAAIVLTVRNDNPAKRLYKRFGFTVIDEVTNRVGTKSSKMLLKFEG